MRIKHSCLRVGLSAVFLLHCSLFFKIQPHLFLNYWAKIAYITSLLSGRALQWARSIWDTNGLITSSLMAFTRFLQVHDQLYHIHQRKSLVPDYTLRFRTIAAVSGWNEAALITTYCQCLSPSIRHQMVIWSSSSWLSNIECRTSVQNTQLSPHVLRSWRPPPTYVSCSPTMPSGKYCIIQLPPDTVHLTWPDVIVIYSVSAKPLIDFGSAGSFHGCNKIHHPYTGNVVHSEPHEINSTSIKGKSSKRSPTCTGVLGCFQ